MEEQIVIPANSRPVLKFAMILVKMIDFVTAGLLKMTLENKIVDVIV